MRPLMDTAKILMCASMVSLQSLMIPIMLVIEALMEPCMGIVIVVGISITVVMVCVPPGVLTFQPVMFTLVLLVEAVVNIVMPSI